MGNYLGESSMSGTERGKLNGDILIGKRQRKAEDAIPALPDQYIVHIQGQGGNYTLYRWFTYLSYLTWLSV